MSDMVEVTDNDPEVEDRQIKEIIRTFNEAAISSTFVDGISVIMPGKEVVKIGFFEELPTDDSKMVHKTNTFLVMTKRRFLQSVKILNDAAEALGGTNVGDQGK